jgi:hypothetical protein
LLLDPVALAGLFESFALDFSRQASATQTDIERSSALAFALIVVCSSSETYPETCFRSVIDALHQEVQREPV